MNTRTRRTREEQRAETRARLLEAAAEVIAARGLEGASIDEITERAGYTRGAFYSNFSGKPELLIELCEQRLRAYADEMVPHILAAPEGERVAHAASLLVATQPVEHVMLLVELARLRDTNPEVAELLDGFAERFTDLVEGVLRGSAADLGDPDPAQLRAGARGLVGALLGVAFANALGVGDETSAQLLLAGVGAAAFPDAPVHDLSPTVGRGGAS